MLDAYYLLLLAAALAFVAASEAYKAMRRRSIRGKDPMLDAVIAEVLEARAREPMLREFFASLLNASSFEEAVAFSVADRLYGRGLSRSALFDAFMKALSDGTWREHGASISTCLRRDCQAVMERDPACNAHIDVLLYYKGYAALAAHRVAKRAWARGDTHFALWLQSQVSQVCGVDIHPDATIGVGVMFDHGTGVVVGETAVIGEGCSILHGVTLGATGKERGDRHPKLGKYVLVGAGASILGNISVGDGAKVGSGSIVLRPIPAGATAVGAPAKIIGRAKEPRPAEDGDNGLYNVVPVGDGESMGGDPACVWREISKHAVPNATHIGIDAFARALADLGLRMDDIGNIFFQLDTDNDGLIAESDLDRFSDISLKYCQASCACPKKREQLNAALKHELLAQARILPKTPSDMENAAQS